jgi:ketosteroid isomerase-like protein
MAAIAVAIGHPSMGRARFVCLRGDRGGYSVRTSQPNVEAIETLLPPPGTDLARMFRELRDPKLAAVAAEALQPLFHSEFEAVASYTPTRYPGPYGLRDFWLDWLEPWATYFVDVEEIVEHGDRVLLRSHDRGRRYDMDAEVDQRGGSVWTFRDGKIIRAEFFTSGQGIEAAWA